MQGQLFPAHLKNITGYILNLEEDKKEEGQPEFLEIMEMYSVSSGLDTYLHVPCHLQNKASK